VINKNYRFFLACFLSLVILFSAGCNARQISPASTIQPDTQQSTEEQKKKEMESQFTLGKDLKAAGGQYPDAVPLIGGRGNMTIRTGESHWLLQAFSIDYQDDVEYSWQSDDPVIAQIKKDMVEGVSAGNTHIRLITKTGDAVADIAVTVMKSDAYRVEKSFKPVVGDYYSALAMKDNYIYFGTSVGYQKTRPEQNYFYKMDTNFTEIWKYDLGARETRGSAVLDSDGNIYFTVEDDREPTGPDDVNAIGIKDYHVSIFLYSLTGDGKLRFTKDITEKGKWYHIGMINCAIDSSNTIYIADANLRAYDTSGNVKWQYPVSDDQTMIARGSPVFDDKGNLFVAMGLSLFCFNTTAGGIPKWEVPVQPTGPTISSSPPSFNRDYSKVYFPVYNTVYCLDASSGAKIWEYTPDGITGEFRANAAVDAAGNVYIGTKADYNSTLYAIKADGTGLLWKIMVGGDLYCSPILGDDGLLYESSETSILGAFYAIDPPSGEIIWSLAENDTSDEKQGLAFTGTDWPSLRLKDGYIYCFSDIWTKIKVDANNYAPDAGWPTFRGSNDNSGYRK
jgi:outer membrane protein assembly factor BamB